MVSLKNKALACSFLVLIVGPVSLIAETIISFWKSPQTPTINPVAGWDNSAGFSSSMRFAQVFTAPSMDTVLTGFSFHAYGRSYANFRVNLYEWDENTRRPTTLLNRDPFEWYGVINHGDINSARFQTFEFSGLRYQLNKNKKYALVFMNYNSGMMNWAFNLNPLNTKGETFSTADASAFPSYLPWGGNHSLVQLRLISPFLNSFGQGINLFNLDFVKIGDAGNSNDPNCTLNGNYPANTIGGVSYEYHISKYEITQDNISKANAQAQLGITMNNVVSSSNRPAAGISWNEAARFVNFLNTSKGFPPAYRFFGTNINENIQAWAPTDSGYNSLNPFRNKNAKFFLPSNHEWHKAAYYDPLLNTYYLYPTRSNIKPTAVSSGSDEDTAVFNQGWNGPAEVEYAGGLSPYGTVGQGGNVEEWIEDNFYYPGPLNNNNPLRDRGVRGDDFKDNGVYMISDYSTGWPPAHESQLRGFRVASTAETFFNVTPTTNTPAASNVALWATVSASSTYEDDTQNRGPQKLVDGSFSEAPGTSWFSKGISDSNPGTLPAWVIFDLGREFEIKTISILNIKNTGYNDRGAKSFYISTSLDGVTYELSSNAQNLEWQNTSFQNYELPAHVFARFVKLTIQDSYGAAVGLNEVKIFTPGIDETVGKKTPSILLPPTPSPITFGQAISSSELAGGSATVPGIFVWSAPWERPNAGTSIQSVTFQPTDSINYNSKTSNVTVIVNKATPPVISLPNTSTIFYGQRLESSIISGGLLAFGSTVSSFVGSGVRGYVDGRGAEVEFSTPWHAAFDSDDNLYVADQDWYNVIRKINTIGEVYTLAGDFEAGYVDGIGTAARFAQVGGLAVDSQGNLFVADTNNQRIRKITPEGLVTTFAGGEFGFLDGPIADARFFQPRGVAVDAFGNLFLADQVNCRVRKITAEGEVITLAGTGALGSLDGIGANAEFYDPFALVKDNAGNIYVSDGNQNRIRKISAAGEVTTFAGSEEAGYADGIGTEARFSNIGSLAVDFQGNVYVADTNNNRIRKVTTSGEVTTLAGSGEFGFLDGPSTTAMFANPLGVAVDSMGHVYVIDTGNHRIRKVTSGIVEGIWTWVEPNSISSTGTSNHAVTFTPTDTNNYSTVTTNLNVTVNKAIPAINAAPSATPITYGQALSNSILTGGSASISGLFSFSSPDVVPNGGINSVIITFTPTDTTNYNTVTTNVSLTVNRAVPLITWSNPTAVAFGTELSATQLNALSTVSGTFAYTPTNGAVLNAGTNTLTAVFTASNTNNYLSPRTNTVSLVVTKAAPIITWSNPAPITFGTALSTNTQLNASANAAGSFRFTPTNGAVLNAGTHTLTAIFTASNTNNYLSPRTNTVSLTVNKATPVISNLPAARSIVVGQALSNSILSNGVASVPGTWAWTSPTDRPELGTSLQSVTFTPTATNNFNTITTNVSLTVNLSTSLITRAPTASPIIFGQALSNSVLSSAVASVAGSWAWATGSITPNASLTNRYSVIFTPSNTNTHSSVTTNVVLVVNKAVPSITWSNLEAITFGAALSGTQLNATSPVAGTYGYLPTNGTVLNAGSNNLVLTFRATDSNNYVSPVTRTNRLVINRATPVISNLPTASAIAFSQPLSSSVLGGGSNGVPGRWTWASPTSRPPVGTNTFSVIFTPSNTANFNTVATNVSLTVNQASPAITRLPTASVIGRGQALSNSTLLNGLANVPGSFVWTVPSNIPAAGTNRPGITFLPTDSGNYRSISTNIALVVTQTVVNPTFTSATQTIATANGFIAAFKRLGPLSVNFTPRPGQTIRVINNTSGSGIVGEFDGLSEGGTVSASFGGNTFYFQISYKGGDGNDIILARILGPGQVEAFNTFAGDGNTCAEFNDPPYMDGSGREVRFNCPEGVAVDVFGNVYLADTGNHRIRKVTPAGVVTTLAGSSEGYADGTGAAAQFRSPQGVAVDTLGNVYVADRNNHRIRKVTAAGEVTTLAGTSRGYAEGAGTNAQFNSPFDVAVDTLGNIYVADSNNYRIRKVTSAGVVTTLAGSGEYGYADGNGTNAQFNSPQGVAVDASGNVYVADAHNGCIRKLTAAGVVTTLAGGGIPWGYADGSGTNARFNYPSDVAVDISGSVYVADSMSHRIRKVTSAGVVTTLAGSGEYGYADGNGTNAQFAKPYGVAVDTLGNVYVADTLNHRIRKMTAAGAVPILMLGSATQSGGTLRLAGRVNPNGFATTARFLYGTNSTNLNLISSVTLTPNNGTNGLSVTNVISSGLTVGRTYFYRLTATNVDGPTSTEIRSISF